MSELELIPSIDLRGGRVVRLEQGDYERETEYSRDPAACARRFVACGARRLHVVDLDGARDGRRRNGAALGEILAAAGDVSVQVGGGIRSLADVEQMLELGVQRVIVGTALLEDPEFVREAAVRYPDCVILGLDARDGRLAVRGWELLADPVEDVLARFTDLPFAAVLHTDVAQDGLLKGPNVEATERLARRTPLPVIASGGVGSIDHLLALARTRVIAAAIVGRALYTGDVDLARALEELASC